jgi:hypothetical protein
MRHAALFVCALMIQVETSPPARAATDDAPKALADAWCAAVMAFDENAAVALMTPELQTAVALARAASDAYASTHQDEKPPLGDGLPITSYPDSVQGCTADSLSPSGMLMTFTPAGDGTGAWQDRIDFAPGPDGTLRIANVYYAPDQVIGLSDALREVAEPRE